MQTKPEIRFEDNAEQRTFAGWVCKTCSRFYGNDERMARWCCATTMPCACGGRVAKNWTKCETCRTKADDEKWAARKRQDWDGVTPLYSEAIERYFFDEDDLLDAIAEHGDGDPERLRLLVCEPVFASEIDADDQWCDDLPEDSTLDDVNGDIADAVAKLNEVIAAQVALNKPLSWQPGSVIAVVCALRATKEGRG